MEENTKNEKKEENKNLEKEEIKKDNISNSSEYEEPEEVEISEQEKEKINNRITESRKEAGSKYKEGKYLEALNIYNICLSDAKRGKLKEQQVILYCNQGICFNKLLEKDKALECFSNALKLNDKYSKALANRMLLYNSKEEYLEAYEDFNKLKEIDKKLWDNYAFMEYELQTKAEIKKKEMTNEMLGKLKDLGNSILGNFGMSLNNFKMTPNGQGGYSIQYNNQK